MLPAVVTTLLRFLRPSRALGALVLLAALSIGAAAHAWHHVVDRDCDASSGPSSHACVTCSALHSSSVGEEQAEAPTPRAIAYEPTLLPDVSAPLSALPTQAAPRAPPLA